MSFVYPSSTVSPRLRKLQVNDIELAFFERGVRTADQPTLLFLHCTGFHGRVWDHIIESLPEVHSIALDQRGHGRSEKRTIDHWSIFGQDIIELTKALDLTDVIGIGHSVGGHALVDAAAQCDAFQALVLLDPTIAAPEAYGQPPPFLKEGEVHPAARRRREFDSPLEMLDRLKGKGSYTLFEPRMLEDYCEHGLLPGDDGGFTLACPPEVEASVYMAARTNMEIYERVRAVKVPVTLLRAMLPPENRKAFDFGPSPTWPKLAGEFKNATETYLPDCTHFIPMQMPGKVIEKVKEAIDAWSVI